MRHPGRRAAVRAASTRVRSARSAVVARKRNLLRKIGYGSGSASRTAAGRLTVIIRPSRAAKAALTRTGRLRVAVTPTFQTPGATPQSHRRAITVTAP